jgi:hypothetical protein
MVVTLAEAPTLARKKIEKTTPIRVTDEAIKWARIASGYTGESVAEYASRILTERGQQDADQLHAGLQRPGSPPRPAPKKGGKS